MPKLMISVQNAKLVEFKFGIKLDSLSFFYAIFYTEFSSVKVEGRDMFRLESPLGILVTVKKIHLNSFNFEQARLAKISHKTLKLG